MWDDVVPWYLEPTSETRFEQRSVSVHEEPSVVEFELDESGKATAPLFLAGSVAERGRLECVDDLPEEWKRTHVRSRTGSARLA